MSRRKAILLILLEVLLALWLCCLPRDLFKGTPYATVVTDRKGELLGARIASDVSGASRPAIRFRPGMLRP